jgi:hypothetical protein
MQFVEVVDVQRRRDALDEMPVGLVRLPQALHELGCERDRGHGASKVNVCCPRLLPLVRRRVGRED